MVDSHKQGIAQSVGTKQQAKLRAMLHFFYAEWHEIAAQEVLII